jgi:sec-independent protein translocase protein TatA
MIGPLQLVLILLIILVLFGAGRLPSVMKDLGKGLRSFKSGLMDKDDDKIEKDQKK